MGYDTVAVKNPNPNPKSASHTWWFDSHNSSPRSSPWLSSTLSELNEKTKAMLKLIEEDADSFAQRAEMYYKKRPELVDMVEDFYRAHRSLAEQYDHLKLEAGTRHATPLGSPFSTRSWSQKLKNSIDKASRTSSNSFDSEESEVDDPEQEKNEVDSGMREVSNKESGSEVMKLMIKEVKGLKEENKIVKAQLVEKDEDKREAMTEELEKLKEENKILKAQLVEKDEEKREVIRQLSLSMNILKEENTEVRKCIRDSKKWGLFEFRKLKKGVFSGKLFGGFSKFQPTLVSL